jgi:hypothetical protein
MNRVSANRYQPFCDNERILNRKLSCSKGCHRTKQAMIKADLKGLLARPQEDQSIKGLETTRSRQPTSISRYGFDEIRSPAIGCHILWDAFAAGSQARLLLQPVFPLKKIPLLLRTRRGGARETR